MPRERGDVFGEVDNTRGKAGGAVGERGVVRQELAVLLHGSAATRGVDDDGRVACRFEGIDVATGERAGEVDVAVVSVECAAAALAGLWRRRRSVPGEYTSGRTMDVAEELAHDAAREEDRLP